REQPYAQAKCRQTNASQSGSSGVKGRGIGSSAVSGKPEFLLAFALVFFNERRACTKDCREGEKQTSCFRAENVGHASGQRCCQSTKHEAQGIFVPAALLES